MSEPAVVLVGAAGAGKTTVGRALAASLGTDFVDSDDVLAEAAGMPLDQLMVGLGEAAYRQREGAAVLAALSRGGSVVALGSGSLADPGTRRRLSELPVAWLRVSAANAANRSGLNVPRPVGLGNVRATMAALIAAQEPHYAEAADVEVDTDFREIDDIVAELLAALGRKGSAHVG